MPGGRIEEALTLVFVRTRLYLGIVEEALSGKGRAMAGAGWC